MRYASLFIMIVLALAAIAVISPAAAQESVFPLPAPLYILDSEHTLLRIDPDTGEQVALSSSTQPVADFDIAPDGEWYAYRNLDSMIIVSDLTSGSGYVLQFDVPAPPSSDAPTLAWSPDASKLAYIIPDALRIARLGAGEYGEAQFSDIPGAWTALYWQDFNTLIASDAQASASRISAATGSDQQWTAEPVPGLSASADPAIPSYLTPEGVVMDDTTGNSTIIPATAGILAYDWEPLPPKVVEALDLPADLFYLMADENGAAQVWQVKSGAPPTQRTTEPEGVIAYALSPANEQIAYATPEKLVVADAAGGKTIATIETKNGGVSLGWSPEGSQVAYSDTTGLWIAPASGDYAARLVREHLVPDPNSTEITNIQVYQYPRWSPDGSLLLVTIGLWEGSQQGLISTATGELTPVNAIYASQAMWTRAGQIIGWSGFWGYESPGLFLADPAAPDGPATDLLPPGTPVLTVFQAQNGSLSIVRLNSAQQGPSFIRAQSAPMIGGDFSPPLSAAPGGYASAPQLYAGKGVTFAAGLRNMIYGDQGVASGVLVILDLSSVQGGGIVAPVQIQTPRPVSHLQWGR